MGANRVGTDSTVLRGKSLADLHLGQSGQPADCDARVRARARHSRRVVCLAAAKYSRQVEVALDALPSGVSAVEQSANEVAVETNRRPHLEGACTAGQSKTVSTEPEKNEFVPYLRYQ